MAVEWLCVSDYCTVSAITVQSLWCHCTGTLQLLYSQRKLTVAEHLLCIATVHPLSSPCPIAFQSQMLSLSPSLSCQCNVPIPALFRDCSLYSPCEPAAVCDQNKCRQALGFSVRLPSLSPRQHGYAARLTQPRSLHCMPAWYAHTDRWIRSCTHACVHA